MGVFYILYDANKYIEIKEVAIGKEMEKGGIKMKRKLVLTAILCLILLCLASCGENGQEQGMKEGEVPTVEAETQPDETESQKVLIYYGNENADGIIYKEVTLSELSAEALIDELSKVNIVSLDTKVRTVSVDEENEKLLHLDMSKEFGEYVSMMGTAGEYIVLGGLVDTFLDAYDCEHVKITVEGKPLETGHAIYDGELQFFETQESNP
ncbi:MAG: GerMN domain-containing protein [Lachnospiraceae bacterium]|nr:GerMN domain-containing protein [Lachnospiraceae bacterium]